MSRPGTVIVDEFDHAPFEVLGVQYFVQELVWNGGGRSYDLLRRVDHEILILTENESFDGYPTDAQISAVLDEHGIDAELERCKMCQGEILLATAHRHDSGWVGTCCWGERLRMTE
ncbi:hypothetical protein [Streptomyces hokutonensis]|uniref:hypothetical protein n=1 Tax=Streptomyces hokutonensis TaxID=1306990 RepID=UPI00382013DA